MTDAGTAGIVRGRRLGSSPRSRVWQAEFDGVPAIVKQIVPTPFRETRANARREAVGRFERELGALRQAGAAQPAVVPAVLATDPAELVLVLEFLADTGPPADWVVGYAEALARLHATTVNPPLDPSLDAGGIPLWAGPTMADVDAFLGLAQRLGAPAGPAVRAELAGLVERLAATEATALLHGDPCPGNDVYTVDGVRFVDLEQASRGPGLVELAYLRIGFPTCWCVTDVPPPVRDRAEAGYRAAWRAATGTEPPGDLVDACAGWLIQGDALVERAHRGRTDQFARLLRRDWRWGTVSARERLLHRLGVVADLAGPDPARTGLADLAGAMRARLRQRWPGLNPPPTTRP